MIGTSTLAHPRDGVATATNPVRVLVVDDQGIIRRLVTKALKLIDGVELVGEAINGRDALDHIRRSQPDVLILDVEMPEMNGLELLEQLKSVQNAPKALMFSSLTKAGADTTISALGLGAYDFLVKPEQQSPSTVVEYLVCELQTRLDTYSWIARGRPLSDAAPKQLPRPSKVEQPQPTTTPQEQTRIDAVAIGVSTGGPEALGKLIPQLPNNLHVPVLVVQHMPPLFTKSLADRLNLQSSLPVQEATDGALLEPGTVTIAQGGRHMKVINSNLGPRVGITDDSPIQSCRPSVDYLLKSMGEVYGTNFLPVIMTGMGYDGTDECLKLHKRGVPILAQSARSCVVFGMPRKLIEDKIASSIHLDDLADAIVDRIARNG